MEGDGEEEEEEDDEKGTEEEEGGSVEIKGGACAKVIYPPTSPTNEAKVLAIEPETGMGRG